MEMEGIKAEGDMEIIQDVLYHLLIGVDVVLSITRIPEVDGSETIELSQSYSCYSLPCSSILASTQNNDENETQAQDFLDSVDNPSTQLDIKDDFSNTQVDTIKEDFSNTQLDTKEEDFSNTQLNTKDDFSNTQLDTKEDDFCNTQVGTKEDDFSNTQLDTKDDFRSTQLDTKDDFSNTHLDTEDDFSNTQLDTNDAFSNTQLDTNDAFSNTQLDTKDDFSNTQLDTKDDFSNTQLATKDDFSNTQLDTKVVFSSTQLDTNDGFSNTQFITKDAFNNTQIDVKDAFSNTQLDVKDAFSNTQLDVKDAFTVMSQEFIMMSMPPSIVVQQFDVSTSSLDLFEMSDASTWVEIMETEQSVSPESQHQVVPSNDNYCANATKRENVDDNEFYPTKKQKYEDPEDDIHGSPLVELDHSVPEGNESFISKAVDKHFNGSKTTISSIYDTTNGLKNTRFYEECYDEHDKENIRPGDNSQHGAVNTDDNNKPGSESMYTPNSVPTASSGIHLRLGLSRKSRPSKSLHSGFLRRP